MRRTDFTVSLNIYATQIWYCFGFCLSREFYSIQNLTINSSEKLYYIEYSSCILIYIYVLVIDMGLAPRLFHNKLQLLILKVYMTRNCLSPSWKDLLKLYNNFFCSF